MSKGLEDLTYEEGLSKLGFPHLGEKKAQRDLFSAYKYLMGECKEDGARLFSVVLSNRTRGNGQRLEHKRIHQNTRKYFFTVSMTEHWHRLTTEVVKSPS